MMISNLPVCDIINMLDKAACNFYCFGYCTAEKLGFECLYKESKNDKRDKEKNK